MSTRLAAFIAQLPNASWVRVESVSRKPGVLEISFIVARKRRGRVVDRQRVRCRGVRESLIPDRDGGGIRLYPADHPVARQYWSSPAMLRWRPLSHRGAALSALRAAHAGVVGDWFPFARYTGRVAQNATVVLWKGPGFLMRSYARALQSIGLKAQLVPSRGHRVRGRPRCLHFGDSFVVADRFEVGSEAA